MTDQTVTPQAEGEETFDQQWQKFLSHDFGEDQPQTTEGTDTQTQSAGADTQPAPAASGADTVSGGADTITASTTGQDNAAGPASDDVPAEGSTIQPTVDAKLVAEMLGLGSQSTPAEPAPAPQGSGQTSEGTTPSDETFMPFTPDFKLQPQLMAALFESEDAETRSQALVNLLSAFGNTITHVMEARFREHYAPSIMQAYSAQQSEASVAAAVHQDFYSTFPELVPYSKAVTRAFEVISKSPEFAGKPYSEEIRNMVGALARQGVQAAGVKFDSTGQQAPAAPAKAAPAAPSVTPFEAGGARPGGGEIDNGPMALVEQLSAWA